jgi:hypothetical protein
MDEGWHGSCSKVSMQQVLDRYRVPQRKWRTRSVLLRQLLALLTTTPVLLAGSSAHAAAEVSDATRTAFTATFQFAGGEKEMQSIEAGIDYAIDGLFFVIKPVARGKLRAATKLMPNVSFAFHDRKVESRAPGSPTIVSPENGDAISYEAADGNIYRTTQRWVGADGTRRNEYTLDAEGKTLTMDVTVVSPKLSHRVKYRLTYQKK